MPRLHLLDKSEIHCGKLPTDLPHAQRSSPRPEIFPTLVRLLLAGVFVIAAGAKAQNLAEFESTLVASRLFPSGIVSAIAAVIIVVAEAAFGIGILLPKLHRTSLQALCLLCCSFISYSMWRWLQNIDVPCHCFGIFFNLKPYQAILLNCALLSCIVFLTRCRGMLSPLLARSSGKGGEILTTN
jgi:uncharacterized membrane protein YphA (DoxX/SURF4 family)